MPFCGFTEVNLIYLPLHFCLFKINVMNRITSKKYQAIKDTVVEADTV